MSEQEGAIIIDFVRARMERLAQNALEELNLHVRDASSLDFFYFLWHHMMASGLEEEKDVVIKDINDEEVQLSVEGLIHGYPELFNLVMNNPQYSFMKKDKGA
jgi:hypothetical protein